MSMEKMLRWGRWVQDGLCLTCGAVLIIVAICGIAASDGVGSAARLLAAVLVED